MRKIALILALAGVILCFASCDAADIDEPSATEDVSSDNKLETSFFDKLKGEIEEDTETETAVETTVVPETTTVHETTVAPETTAVPETTYVPETTFVPETTATPETIGRDIPNDENYHGHVYTGGQYSKKYHYEPNCAGKYSHEITWEEVDARGLTPCGTCVLK